MNEKDRQELEEAMNDLKEMTHLSMDIVTAKKGDERSLEELQEPRTVEGEFPGNRDRAMGHALVIEEDLEELGISAEREYVEPTDHGHRIDIHIAGGEKDGR